VEPANVLKIESLPENWRDKDEILLHASFQLLKNFIEQEKEIIEQINWKHDEETENAKSELDFLYNW
jgi:putative ATP-dependent endonuclease of the OLD family